MKQQTVRDITRIPCFVTTMKLPHALQIYSIVSVQKCMWSHFSRQCSNKLSVKWQIQLHVCGRIISVCNSERIIKIRQYLQKLCSNQKRVQFFLTHSVVLFSYFCHFLSFLCYLDYCCIDCVGFILLIYCVVCNVYCNLHNCIVSCKNLISSQYSSYCM